MPEPTVNRKELSQATGLTYWQLRIHLKELCDLEYVTATFNGTGRRAHYALIEDEDVPPPLVLA